MKYKVGDKVRVRKDLVVGNSYGYPDWVGYMERYKGEEVIIKNVFENYYQIFDDSGYFCFSDEMFEDETISVARENLMNAYNSGESETRYMLKQLFPDVFKKKKVEKVIWVNMYSGERHDHHCGYEHKEDALSLACSLIGVEHTAVEFRGFVEE